jgi:hypothetical protein
MNDQIIVCNFYPELISKFSNRSFVIRTDNSESVSQINKFFNGNNSLYVIWLDLISDLSTIAIDETWKDIPLAIYSKGIGVFTDLMIKLDFFKSHKIIVFLPSTSPECYTELKILASLGVNCGMVFNHQLLQWSKISDIMHYSVYTQTKHAIIEPFHYITLNYQPSQLLDFDNIYFNNPEKFIHLDDKGNIALTYQKLLKGEFISNEIDDLSRINELEPFIQYIESWHKHFLDTKGCGYCQAWRICLGKFHDHANGCAQFFCEMLEAADYVKKKK